MGRASTGSFRKIDVINVYSWRSRETHVVFVTKRNICTAALKLITIAIMLEYNMNHVDKIIPLSACVTRVYGIAHVLVIVVVVTAHGGGKYGGDGADGADAGDGTDHEWW